jgi:hypothetical protein
MTYKTIFLPIATITLGFLSGVIHADPITIAGLNWGMSIEEMETQLEQNEYVCGDAEINSSPDALECIEGEKEIILFPDEEKIRFYCEVYSGCGFTNREVARALVDNGVVDQMEPFNPPLWDQGTKYRPYKGRGTDGDLIEAYPSIFDGTSSRIELLKGAYGSGGLEF